MRFFKFISVSLALCSLMYAADDEQSYIFEAKGDFAKELKSLVEKYSKESNVSINVYENAPQTQSGRFLNIGVDGRANYSAKRGEELYAANCSKCHGEKGEKRAYGTSRPLTKISADDIETAFAGYLTDPDFGDRNRHLMKPVAVTTTYKDLGDIIVFLKGKDALKFINGSSVNQNTDVSTTPTQGSYLK